MSDQLQWDHGAVSSSVTHLDATHSEISNQSVSEPSGCGSSAASAEAVVSDLQSALTGLAKAISSQSSLLTAADKLMRTTDDEAASSAPTRG